MATSDVAVTEGSGKNLATHSISEDAITKEISRVNLNTAAGVEVAPLTDVQLRATPVPVSLASVPSLATGTNNIGDVDIASIAAGDNNIGNVDIVTVPVDPFGANADAAVAAGAAGSIQAKLRRATQGLEDLKSLIVLAAGTNAIGKLAANSGVDIGDVDVTTLGGQAPAFGSGAAGATVLRVVNVTDDPIVTAVGSVETAISAGGITQVDHDAAATGVQPLVGGGVASAAAPADVSADGDAVRPWFLRNGAQAINVTAAGALIGGDATNGMDVDVTRLSPVAHDAATAENPIKVGFQAIAGLSGATLVAAADKTYGYSGLDGAQITRPHCGLEDIVSGVAAITDGSSTSVIASAGAGVKNYITTAIIANTSATAVTVDLRDGAAGAVKATFPVPANTSGVVCNLPVPLPFSAATAVCADPSAAASTVTVTLIGFKSKV